MNISTCMENSTSPRSSDNFHICHQKKNLGTNAFIIVIIIIIIFFSFGSYLLLLSSRWCITSNNSIVSAKLVE